ncbi:hypothetical protein CSA57_05345 [candidate division KSB3 bacterium]|nr:MAG: hypothetical protein CSA57_05345 [candidate division KSB3 bacterium]
MCLPLLLITSVLTRTAYSLLKHSAMHMTRRFSIVSIKKSSIFNKLYESYKVLRNKLYENPVFVVIWISAGECLRAEFFSLECMRRCYASDGS